jgi:Phosphoribosylanthranilate isomerase
MRVKVCGITRPEDARCAGRLGAWAVGVILFSASPRSVSPERAEEIFRALPPSTLKVAVSDTSRKEDLAAILALELDALQIYHPFTLPSERPYRVFRVGDGGRIPEDADALVLDDSHGTGRRCDPLAARTIVAGSPLPVILSGGLNPGNVVSAIREIHPWAVDASSGLESAPGVKIP